MGNVRGLPVLADEMFVCLGCTKEQCPCACADPTRCQEGPLGRADMAQSRCICHGLEQVCQGTTKARL